MNMKLSYSACNCTMKTIQSEAVVSGSNPKTTHPDVRRVYSPSTCKNLGTKGENRAANSYINPHGSAFILK